MNREKTRLPKRLKCTLIVNEGEFKFECVFTEKKKNNGSMIEELFNVRVCEQIRYCIWMSMCVYGHIHQLFVHNIII